MSEKETNIESINPKEDNGSDKIKSTFSSEATSMDIQDHKNADVLTAMKIESTLPSSAAENALNSRMNIPDSDSEYRQWLQSMLQVARLPGGLPAEFRRKLWLALAERYLKRKSVDWEIEKIKWFGDNWRADDEKLAIQIVKDLHRTGHSMLSGASGELYQSKLKKILIGYSRWNPEVGYCQGFNMLGAIILQVMGKCEVDSIKVMIFLIEGLLPNGYFSGGLIGLQADMAVFRELLGYKLPKLARHLEKLQGSTQEPSFEPPIINVFTIQWFLTLFCNCLPMSYVLRIWDLIMIEGSDILLRAALSIWKMLEDRILREVLTADDFYCKMESLSAELLNGTLIDANRLIHMISSLGPINNLQQLRQKHLTASLNDQKRLKMLYTSAEKESRLTTRRGSQPRGQTDREKIALDITVLKKQYDKLRERQKQAHIILSSAVTKQQQQQQNPTAGTSNVNKFLAGKNAIVSKGRKGPPKGAIPPARNQRGSRSSKTSQKPEETMQWKNMEEARRRNSVTWKEINSERRKEELKKSSSATDLNSPSKRRSDSSSYSEESDNESSPSTSLCDEDANVSSSREVSPLKKKRVKDLQIGATKPTLNHIIEEASPVLATAHDAKLSQDCPTISITTDGWKSVSPNTRFYLELPTNFGDNITSTAQLSPLPDLSNYFTAISPIKTPCGFFELPEFNNFLINDDEKYQVNDNGVTNEFFERCYEDNLTSSMIDKLPSPPSENENKRKPFYMHQKSLSMDEKALNGENETVVAINRSYSDGTVRDNIEDFQRIVAENSKMLNKLIPLVEESKSPMNLSDVEEEEIAAIDKSDETEKEVYSSDIQDIGNMEVLLRERISISSSSSACNITTTKEDESNVTTMNLLAENSRTGKCGNLEKSMTEDKNEASCAQATPILSLEENSAIIDDDDVAEKKIVEGENRGKESERCHPSARGGDGRDKLESPKFNEIQLMVLKLKEEMESQMKSDGEEVKKEVEQKLIEELKEKIEIREIAEKIESEVEKGTKAGKVVQIAIIVESEESDGQIKEIENSSVEIEEEKAEKCSEKSSEKKIDEKNENTTTPPNGDLEKIASKAQQKIDTSDDPSCMTTTTTTTVTTTKTACENCQRRQKEEIDTVKLDDCHQKPKKSVEKNVTPNSTSHSVSVDTKNVVKSEKSSSIVVVKKSEKPISPTPKKQIESEKKNVAKKETEAIEILSRELSRYKFDESSRIIVQEKLDEKKNAILELAEMIKEREMEKMNEMKKLEKVIEHRGASISPARSCRSRSNCCSPTESMVSSSSRLYDHEPRSDVRRRDILSMENENRLKKSIRSSASPHEHSSTSPTTSNIRDTLSSIQNTIKYLDSCCKHTKKEERPARSSRRDKTPPRRYERVVDNFGNVVCENDFNYIQPRTRYHSSPPSYYDNDVSPMRMSTSSYEDDYYRDRHETRLSRNHTFDDDELRYNIVSPMPVRRARFDRSLSPVRNRYDYEDPMTISSSSYRPRSDISSVSPSRYFTRTPDFDPGLSLTRIRGMSTEQYLATKRSPLGGSRERLNLSRSPYGGSREALFVSKSPLGSRDRLDVSSGAYRSALGGSRDRLNALGSRATFDDSHDYLSTLKSSLGASRERLNVLASFSKSPYTSNERLSSSKSSAIDNFDRYSSYSSKKAFGSSDRLDMTKSSLAGSRDRLDISSKPLSSCLSTSREKLTSFDRSKSPANDNFEKFHPSKSPIVTATRDSLDVKYGIARSPTSPSISTTTTHVSRAPTKSPVQITSTTSYTTKCHSEERSSSKPLEVPSKFVRFDPSCKSRSPVYDSSVDKKPNTANFSNSTLIKSKAIDDDWKKSTTTTRKYDF